MKTWFQQLTSFEWWIGVVLVSVVVNLVSAYMKGPCDRVLSGVSKWWSTRSEAQRKARVARIARLRASTEEQMFALVQALDCRLRSVTMNVLGWVMLVVVLVAREDSILGEEIIILVAMMFLTLTSMMLGTSGWFDAKRQLEEIDEARESAK